MTYLEDGRCSFSNNLSENAIRPFTVGRKNWLFCDTPNGAQASAIVYTMVEMAKANGVNVYHYLTYLLEKCLQIRQVMRNWNFWRHGTKMSKRKYNAVQTIQTN